MDFDAVLLARIQFAFTISFHIIFPSFTIGLAAFIATLLVRWRITGREHLHRLARFWTKIFAVSFAMGVVSGIVMSYEFGTNWSNFSVVVGNVLGPLLGYEVLTAFFLRRRFQHQLFDGSACRLHVISGAVPSAPPFPPSVSCRQQLDAATRRA
jgi:cytochrome d ubiquinol oxidase subunit I